MSRRVPRIRTSTELLKGIQALARGDNRKLGPSRAIRERTRNMPCFASFLPILVKNA